MFQHVKGICRFAFVAALISGTALGQSIVTTAGGGTIDGQQATNIPTGSPRGIAFDRAGNVYLVIGNSSQVVRIDPATGVVQTIAGNGGSGFSGDGGLAVNATLSQPRGIAIDAEDNIFIADETNDRVRRVDAKTGIIATYAGGGSPAVGIGDGGQATAAALRTPRDLAVAKGLLYITEPGYDAHRIRTVNLATGVISTIAGKTDGSGGGFAGDGGLAIGAQLDSPYGIVVDGSGSVFFADSGNHRVRRIDTSGVITTYAGGGTLEGAAADGQPATSAAFKQEVTTLALDTAGNVIVAALPDLRRIDRSTQLISTAFAGVELVYGVAVDRNGVFYYSDYVFDKLVKLLPGATEGITIAGGGKFIGDGLPATAAILHNPQGLAIDVAGNYYIADSNSNVVRRVSAADGTITTVAGTIGLAYSSEQEGFKAVDATIGFPRDLALDATGNLYISDPLNNRIWRVTTDGVIRTFAGGGNPPDNVGDNGLATSAFLYPRGIGLDRAGNLYIADGYEFADVQHHRIRKVDAQTRLISTIAGGSTSGSTGDGGQATQALLNTPTDVAVDESGNIFISDFLNAQIRRIDRSGVITRYAGRYGNPFGDNGPAADASLSPLSIEINRVSGDLFFIDGDTHRVRKIDARTTVITTVAGSGVAPLPGDFSGDNGAATAAKFHFVDQGGLAFNSAGDLYIADSANHRVRAVFACGDVGAPGLTSPRDGSSASTAPELTWSRATRAVRYDVFLDTISSPARIIANDVSGTSLATSNLQPSTRYFWRVVAKGDPFCPPLTAPSSISSFTTSGVCAAAPFSATAPADNASVSTPAVLTWQPSSGAAAYDVYLGTTSPPPLFAGSVTGTSFTATVPNGRYFWFVVARAACDPTKTSTTTVRSFDLIGGVSCTPGQLRVSTTSPANGSATAATSLPLTWAVDGAATSFDVYFGTAADPPLINANVTTLQQEVAALSPATRYYWRIVAKGPCDPNGASSAVASFTTRSCSVPGQVAIAFAPASVGAGTTYTIVWSPAAGLDADGAYLVERSRNPGISSEVQTQVVSTTAATFDAEIAGTYYHRITALPGCDPARAGQASSIQSVTVTAARANVVMTVQPVAEIIALGERLADHRGSFALENLGSNPLQVIVGRQELGGSPPFFTIFDPLGGESAFVTLQPRTPRTFEIRYSGPPDNVPASYQGVIFLASTGEGLSVTPYAFVNLKVGGSSSAAPQIIVDGTPVSYAAFSPFAGDDRNRPPLAITVRNPGTAPMDLGAEIGPEGWLVPETGWNSLPLPAGAARTVNLFTRRDRAPNGSPLPRYTYFTLRTKDGASTRLLVQDNDDVSISSGRTIRLGAGERSIIVPEVVSRTGSSGAVTSTVRLSNVGNDRVQTELIFTPAGADGFDAGIRRAVVVVPPNDVVTLIDPVVQLFRLPRPQSGQIEIRIARERQGLVNVTSSTGAPGRGAAYPVPVLNRGDGARAGRDHVILDVRNDASTTTALTLAETTGIDAVNVRLKLIGSNGSTLGTISADVPRYGYRRFDNVVSALGGAIVDGGRIEITVERGAGAVSAIAFVGGASTVSVATAPERTAGALALRLGGKAVNTTLATVVPLITTSSASGNMRTKVGLVAPNGFAVTFNAVFRNAAGGAPVSRQIPVGAGATTLIRNVFEFFGVQETAQGSIVIDTPSGSKVYAVVESTTASSTQTSPSTFLPLPTTLSEALTSAGASAFGQRPLFYDGLEQSTDRTRGTSWTLLLNEVGGAGGNVTVRLYEAANRGAPIAQKDFNVTANQQLSLDTVFALLDLDLAQRRKDRTNVLVTVSARAGNARIAATAISTDNVTGELKAFALLPSAGSGSPSISLVTPVLSAPTIGKRRAVRH